MRTNWKTKLKTVLGTEKIPATTANSSLTITDNAFNSPKSFESSFTPSSVIVSGELTTKSKNAGGKKALSVIVSDELLDSSENQSLNQGENLEVSLNSALTITDNAAKSSNDKNKLFAVSPKPEQKLHAFQTPWEGVCFTCEKPVANYTDNCPHCRDFPGWF